MNFRLFADGGLFITIPIFTLLIVILILFFKGLTNKDNNSKTISLISSIAWFTVAWGYLGRTLALINSFDAIQAVGEISPKVVAPGLKMALISPLFGIVVFIIARLGIIILIWMNKKEDTE